MADTLERLRFPVGPFDVTAPVNMRDIPSSIDEIAEAPQHLRVAVAGLTERQLDSPYRPEGWTVRQVAHHLVDSHMNSIVRMKLALTEDEPTIKPYDEKRWAELADSKTAPIALAVDLVELMHQRWAILLRSLKPDDFERAFLHPEMGRVGMKVAVALYAWHGRHHIAHITSLRKREGW